MDIVIHLATGSEKMLRRVLDHAANHVRPDVESNDNDDDVVVLANNEGVALLSTDGPQTSRVTELMDQGVVFRACDSSVEEHDLTPERLLDDVEVVATAEAELERLQEAGFEYVAAPDT